MGIHVSIWHDYYYNTNHTYIFIMELMEHHLSFLPSESERGHRIRKVSSISQKVCMYIMEQIFFHYGPIRVLRWTSVFIIPIVLIIATKLKRLWTHIVTEQNKNTT